MVDYKQTFKYLALSDKYVADNCVKDEQVNKFLLELRQKLKEAKGNEKAKVWHRAYAYAIKKQNLFLYKGLHNLNNYYVTQK